MVIGVIGCAMRGRDCGSCHNSKRRQMLELGSDVSNAITSVAKDSYVLEFYEEEIEDG